MYIEGPSEPGDCFNCPLAHFEEYYRACQATNFWTKKDGDQCFVRLLEQCPFLKDSEIIVRIGKNNVNG